ncbi:hypothetical protein Cabys_2698 [Caldithrix abyssi DSM 13497]|uniref:Uncharacterized protein n=1 Tax=Caldithrix abyssi DSM 13497 TaxID=880073 RepID=A0A1J1CA93_CALAY|nr:hypothetical protein Cabys_2698 [Caldithrix abyssi DSM 13497]
MGLNFVQDGLKYFVYSFSAMIDVICEKISLRTLRLFLVAAVLP